ncbi:MAG TPA: hypothetical protein VF119_05565, partial [Candidatus Limnocylindrales bacterium]
MAVAANEARQILRRQRRFQVVEIEVADVGSHHGDPAARDALTDLAQVTSHGDDDTRVGTPTWTPDGTRILFTLIPRSASADGDRYAAFIDLDGSDLTVLSG